MSKTKIFENRLIHRTWYEEKEGWYFSFMGLCHSVNQHISVKNMDDNWPLGVLRKLEK